MKKLASLVSFAIFASLFAVPASAENFDDVNENNSTAYERVAIEELKKSGVIGGYSDETFRPEDNINRAEFLKIVMEAEGHEVSGENCFKDVRDGWFAPYVCSAADLGIVSGYKDGTFKPDQNITFAEASKILSNAFHSYADSKYTDTWYEGYVVALENRKAIPDSVTSFGHLMTRGEMAFSVYKLSGNDFEPYYKDRLTYADIKALEKAGDFKFMRGLEPHNLYTDGVKVYAVASAKVKELEGADPETFTFLDREKTTRMFKDEDDIFYFGAFGVYENLNEREVVSSSWAGYSPITGLDYQTVKVIGTQYSIVDLKKEYEENTYGDGKYWDGWILLRDKNGLYSHYSELTGDVKNIAKFEIYPCAGYYMICGTDGEGFYFAKGTGLSLQALKGFDFPSFSTVKDQDGNIIPALMRDKNYLYELHTDNVQIVGGMDVKNLKILFYGQNPNSYYEWDKYLYFADNEEVWFCHAGSECRSEIIAAADPKTFDYEKHMKNQ